MNKTIFSAFFSLFAACACLNGQEAAPTPKGYTALAIIPVGERPVLGWKAKGQGLIVDPNANLSGFPPGILYYKQQEAPTGKSTEKKDPYAAVQIVLGMSSPWEYITPSSSSVNLLEMSGKNADGAPLYKDYTGIKFPEGSKGGIVFLWQKNAKTWANPNQLVIPLELFVDQTTMIPTEGILLANTLPYKMAYAIGPAKGILDPGGKAFIPAASPTATIEYELSLFQNGKWESMMKSRVNIQKDCILFFYSYRNFQNPQRKVDHVAYRWMPLPKLPVSEKPPVPQQSSK